MTWNTGYFPQCFDVYIVCRKRNVTSHIKETIEKKRIRFALQTCETFLRSFWVDILVALPCKRSRVWGLGFNPYTLNPTLQG